MKESFNSNFKNKLHGYVLNFNELENNLLKKYFLKTMIKKLFFDDLIRFYDNYSSVINEKIMSKDYFSDINNEFKISLKLNNIPNNSLGNKIKLSDDIINNKYITIQYFILELEKMIKEYFEIDLIKIRHILYKNLNFFPNIDICMREFYNNLINIRCGIIQYNTHNSLSIFSSSIINANNIHKLYKNYLKLNILEEYKLKINEIDPRFKLLVSLSFELKHPIKKLEEFPKIIPNNLLSPNITYYSKNTKECIYLEYFNYINYSFDELNELNKKYNNTVFQLIELIKIYNSKIIENDIKK